MIARVAVSTSRPNGIAASLGMGLGGVAFAIAALLGLQAVLLAIPGLYIGLKVLGGLYLCYLGFRIFKSANQTLAVHRGEATFVLSTLVWRTRKRLGRAGSRSTT